MSQTTRLLPVETPEPVERTYFDDPVAAVDRLTELYARATGWLKDRFVDSIGGATPEARYRAYYPELRLTTASHSLGDSRLSFGHVALPGSYVATITRPDLFRDYLIQQIGLLIRNHQVPVAVGDSDTPIPVHFAVAAQTDLNVPQEGVLTFSLRDVFDVPDLDTMNDDIVNGIAQPGTDGTRHLAPSPRSGWITRWRGCRTTPRPRPSISRPSCFSPTTSSTWTSSRPSPAARWPIRPRATRPSWRRGIRCSNGPRMCW